MRQSPQRGPACAKSVPAGSPIPRRRTRANRGSDSERIISGWLAEYVWCCDNRSGEPAAPMANEILTLAQFAERYQFSPRWVREFILARHIPVLRAGRQIRF